MAELLATWLNEEVGLSKVSAYSIAATWFKLVVMRLLTYFDHFDLF